MQPETCVGLNLPRNRQLLSIVAPAHNEEEGLREFALRLERALAPVGLAYEIVFVNDGSTDGTLGVMAALRNQNPAITIVNLSRNFGKEIATTAGLAHAVGDAIVIIDTDLQDPPELIPELVRQWRAGFDMVYAKREARDGESWLKKATARWFYRLATRMGHAPIPENVGDFRLISRRVAEALLQFPEHHRFMKGLYAWVGFPQTSVSYRREPRFAGGSKWGYWKLWNYALEGITSFTIIPLKLASYLGLSVAAAAVVYGVWTLLRTLIWGDVVQGFPTLMITILFLGGVQLTVLGVIGEYLGRVFNETKRRPLYFAESVIWSSAAADRSGARGAGERHGAPPFASALPGSLSLDQGTSEREASLDPDGADTPAARH